jgi:hypothetical protein
MKFASVGLSLPVSSCADIFAIRARHSPLQAAMAHAGLIGES